MSRKKSRQIRVDFRKNRANRSRVGDITRQVRSEGDQVDDRLSGAERISGKGSLSRRRTIIGETTEDGGQIIREIDESQCLRGRVVSSAGLNSTVVTENGLSLQCTVRRIVRTLARDERSAIVVGDLVYVSQTDPEHGVVERVEPRHGIVSRGTNRQEQVLVANVDQLVIAVSASDPPLKPALIDRFLVSAEKGKVHGIVCINKIDLVDPVALQPLAGTYARLGYDVVLASTLNGAGVPYLRDLLKGKATAFAGQSGVGKSSLLNAIQPGLSLLTGGVSGWTRKGKHTTRVAVMHRLDFGGWVIDTPGVRQFSLWDVPSTEVEAHFPEFRPFVPRCRFKNCLHVEEEGCGIRQAVMRGLISPLRYEGYLSILEGTVE